MEQQLDGRWSWWSQQRTSFVVVRSNCNLSADGNDPLEREMENRGQRDLLPQFPSHRSQEGMAINPQGHFSHR